MAARAASLAVPFVSYRHPFAYLDHLVFVYLSDLINAIQYIANLLQLFDIFLLPPRLHVVVKNKKYQGLIEISRPLPNAASFFVTFPAFLEEYLTNDLLKTSKSYLRIPSKEEKHDSLDSLEMFEVHF